MKRNIGKETLKSLWCLFPHLSFFISMTLGESLYLHFCLTFTSLNLKL